MDAKTIRQELCERYGYTDPYKVCCYNCKYWGFNCGKVLNSQCESRCTKRKGVNYDFHCYCLYHCRIVILCHRRISGMGDMVWYSRLAFSCWHLPLYHRRGFAYNLASGKLCLTVPPHGRDTPFFCQWVALLLGGSLATQWAEFLISVHWPLNFSQTICTNSLAAIS